LREIQRSETGKLYSGTNGLVKEGGGSRQCGAGVRGCDNMVLQCCGHAVLQSERRKRFEVRGWRPEAKCQMPNDKCQSSNAKKERKMEVRG
jgi:hypothetical protein